MRQIVQDTIEMLGGKFTPALSLATTHLVCASENTDKYRHCVKDSLEGRKIVSLEWLCMCAQLGMRVQEAQYAFTRSQPSDAAQHAQLCARLELMLMADNDGVTVRRHGLFAGKYFAAHALSAAERDYLKRWLAKEGGWMLRAGEARACDRADYVVVDHGAAPPPAAASAALVVSSTWVRACLHVRAVLPVKECVAFRPLACRVPLAGANAVRVHVTGHDSQQSRLLAEVLGFVVCEALSRAVTHLIVMRSDCNLHKIAAAHRMGVACVSAEWLTACAAAGQVVVVSGFAIDVEVMAKAEIEAATKAQLSAASRSLQVSDVVNGAAASSDDDDDSAADVMMRILRGVSLYVARDAADRERLHALADELGAATALQPDAAVTHFVYSGVPHKSAEYHALMRRRADAAKLHCVAPLWLSMCRDARRRVDETLMPSTFDPMRVPLMPAHVDGNNQAAPDAVAPKAEPPGKMAPPPPPPPPQQHQQQQQLSLPPSRKRTAAKGGASTTAVLRTKRLDIPREQPRAVARVTSGPAPVSKISFEPEASDDGGFGDVAAPPPPPLLPPANAAAELDALLADRIEGLLDKMEASPEDSPNDAMPLDLADNDAMSDDPVAVLLAPRRPARVSAAHESAGAAHDADTTSMVSVVAPQTVRYGLSADEKKRRDEALARSKRRKLAIDGGGAEQLAKQHESTTSNGNSEQLGVHVCVSNFSTAKAEELARRLRALSAVVDKEVQQRVTTHIVINFPSRSVKFLCGLASGAWLVTSAWVDASERAGFIVDPTAYEWSPRVAQALNDAKVAEALKDDARIFKAPALNRRSCVTTASTVFADWTITLFVDDKRRSLLEPILRCGGATVHAKLVNGLSHIMIENSNVGDIDAATLKQIRSLGRCGVQIVNTTFLHEYLITFPRPNPNATEFQVQLPQSAAKSSSMSKGGGGNER
jgi:hypothetical protein